MNLGDFYNYVFLRSYSLEIGLKYLDFTKIYSIHEIDNINYIKLFEPFFPEK